MQISKKIKSSIRQLQVSLCISFYRRLPIKRNKIILWANNFRQYGCSPKYITEYILKNYPHQFEITWVFENNIVLPGDLPLDIKVVRLFSLGYLREVHTAHFVVSNMRTGSWYLWSKRDGQKYIQTWHSSLRLKKIEKDAQDFLPQHYIQNAIEDSARIDLLVSGCEFSTKIFLTSFWYNGEILKCGTPRCDLFFSKMNNVKNKVCTALNIASSYKLILYAPTFRNNKGACLYNLDFRRLLNVVEERFGGKWIVVYRFHPNIISTYSYNANGVDASLYSDMQELIEASEILITDYSSCMFDVAIASKPCFLYTPDLDDYTHNERGLYFSLHDLPFPVALSNDGLIELVRKFDDIGYHNDVRDFMNYVGSYENGTASKQIVDYILKYMK